MEPQTKSGAQAKWILAIVAVGAAAGIAWLLFTRSPREPISAEATFVPTPSTTSPAATDPGSAAQCPDLPSQILLPLRPGEPGYATDPHLAPPPDTVVTTDVINIKARYDTLLRKVFDIPEYHDCQRLIQPNRKYGQLAGVFSLDATHPPFKGADFEQAGGVAVLMVYNYTDHKPIYAGTASTSRNATAQKMTSSDSASYGRRSCVYLEHAVNAQWKARIWQIPTSLPTCPLVLPTSIQTTPLQVVRTSPSKDTADYPPAARWDFDAERSVQYMGVRCMDGWCEIGPTSGFKPSQVLATGGDRYHTIKGWYDEQFLAMKSPTGGGAPVPGGMLGTFYPETDLSQLTVADYSCRPDFVPTDEPFRPLVDPHLSRALHDVSSAPRRCAPDVSSLVKTVDDVHGFWKKVASISIRQTDAFYRHKFMLDDKGKTFVYLRYNPTLPRDLRWQIRYAPAAGPGKVVKAFRVDHSHSTFNGARLLVPSTVRWKWVLQDETTWNACYYGCCNSHDF